MKPTVRPQGRPQVRPQVRLQKAMYYEAERKSAARNEAFLAMATGKEPLTATELKQLIKLRPAVYGRFVNWLSVLK